METGIKSDVPRAGWQRSLRKNCPHAVVGSDVRLLHYAAGNFCGDRRAGIATARIQNSPLPSRTRGRKHRLPVRLGEVGYEFGERQCGQSKFTTKVALQFLAMLLELRSHRRLVFASPNWRPFAPNESSFTLASRQLLLKREELGTSRIEFNRLLNLIPRVHRITGVEMSPREQIVGLGVPRILLERLGEK